MPTTSAVKKFAPTYIAILVLTLSPVWLVGYFVNQDGAAHANNAWMMLRMLAGDPFFSEIVQFNTLAIPNSVGHWVLALLLLVFSPFIATKLMVSLIFAGTVFGAGFLRYRIYGDDGVKISMLIGAAAAFNWLWLVGFYNFCIGVAIVLITTGLFYQWRSAINIRRASALMGLVLLAYFSHLIAIAVLMIVVAVLSVELLVRRDGRSLALVAVALSPLLPLVYLFRQASAASDMGVSPTWRALDSPTSPVSWFRQAINADPFILISRRSFPLTDLEWSGFAVFAPIVGIAIAIAILGSSTVAADLRDRLRTSYSGFIAIFSILMLFAIFGPDDFGSEHGGVLRQRLMILGVLLFVPVFQLTKNAIYGRVAATILVAVIASQTLALWDYALFSDRVTREYIAASEQLPETGGIASVTVLDNSLRYHSSPVTMINNFSGIGRNLFVWDNYELGHYLFPVVVKASADKQFIYDLTRNSAILADLPGAEAQTKLRGLDAALASDNGRIDTLMVWRDHPGLDEVIERYFEIEPYFRSENFRMFRRRAN